MCLLAGSSQATQIIYIWPFFNTDHHYFGQACLLTWGNLSLLPPHHIPKRSVKSNTHTQRQTHCYWFKADGVLWVGPIAGEAGKSSPPPHKCSSCTASVCDMLMHTCMHQGLLHELVLSVCECGRGRPSVCQYVLMPHIWFPNFPPLPSPPLSSAPLHRDVRTLFCFFRTGGRGWWRGCLMSDGPEYRTSTFFLSSSVFASCLLDCFVPLSLCL